MSHSKRNTSRAVFTSYERTLAKAAWGTNTARLSRDSFLPFASCRLCLLPARIPVSCSHGDIFCKECALKNILSQKQEIKRLKRNHGREEKEAEEKREQDEAEARLRYAAEFEIVQMGLESNSAKIKNVEENESESWRHTEQSETTEKSLCKKRKFQLDSEEVMRIVRDETNKVKTKICEEKANRPTLPSFWAPSITPTSNTKNKLHYIPKKEKQTPICPASQIDNPHIYSLHSLIDVVFTEEASKDSDSNQRICPTCKKALTNTSKAMLIKNCGHVLCKNCVSNLMTKKGSNDIGASGFHSNKMLCFVCNTEIYGKEENGDQKKNKKLLKKKVSETSNSGLVEIRCEGTGFASSGLSTVEKSGVVFQC